MKTKLFLLLIVTVFVMSLSACGMSLSANANSSDTASQAVALPSVTTPEQTITAAFEAMKSADSKVLDPLVQYKDNNKLFGNHLDDEGKELIKAMFANFSYKIGEIKKNGDTATAKIKITNRDISNIGGNIMRYADAKDPLLEAFKNSDGKMVTTDTELTLKKTNGIWKIQMD